MSYDARTEICDQIMSAARYLGALAGANARHGAEHRTEAPRTPERVLATLLDETANDAAERYAHLDGGIRMHATLARNLTTEQQADCVPGGWQVIERAYREHFKAAATVGL